MRGIYGYWYKISNLKLQLFCPTNEVALLYYNESLLWSMVYYFNPAITEKESFLLEDNSLQGHRPQCF